MKKSESIRGDERERIRRDGINDRRKKYIYTYRERKRREGGRKGWKARFRSSSKAGKDLFSLLPLPCVSSQVGQDASAKLQTSVKRRCRCCCGRGRSSAQLSSVQQVGRQRRLLHSSATTGSFSTVAIARRVVSSKI